MSDICPKGHVSTDAEFCSECGASMKARGSLVDAAPKQDTLAAAGGETCPDCMTPRRAGARYCEMCRYDFASRTSFRGLDTGVAAPQPQLQPQGPASAATPGAQPATASPIIPAPAVAASTPPVAPAPAPGGVAPANGQGAPDLAASAQRLKLRIVVDPSLCTEPAPDLHCPVDAPEKIFHLDLDENTLGRQYEGKGIHPEIVIHDPGISRRHLKFVRNAVGAFSVLELGSSNGTLFNGATLEPGVETALKPGDEVTLGMWTRIHVESR